MPNTMLREAFARARELPETDQKRIARDVMDYVDQVRALRADIAAGVRSLDAGQGRELDIEDVIARARAKVAGA
jgi:hypothetical protein